MLDDDGGDDTEEIGAMHHQVGRLAWRGVGAFAAGASLLLATLLGPGTAGAGGPSNLVHDQPGVRQAESSTWPGMSDGSSSPADIELADLLIRDLPVKVQAGEGFAARVAVPSGTSCSGTIAYPNRPDRPLDEAGTRTAPCAWELSVPYGTRPGSAVITIEVSRRGQGRLLFGVTYVDVSTVGRADLDDIPEPFSPVADG